MFDTFKDRLLFVIGDTPFTRWAKERGIEPSTVNEWVNKGRVPRATGMKKLVDSTSIPEEWWLHGSGEPPTTDKPAPHEPAVRHPTPAPNGFVLVPRYDVTGSMGNGQVIHSEQIVDHLAFRAEWVRTELGTSPTNLVLISAVGDSMEPTLRAHDLLLIDRSVTSVKHDAVYAFAVDDELRVKRIQRLFDGSLVIKSDNPGYSAETLPADQAGLIKIIGRVVWSGRRM